MYSFKFYTSVGDTLKGLTAKALKHFIKTHTETHTYTCKSLLIYEKAAMTDYMKIKVSTVFTTLV